MKLLNIFKSQKKKKETFLVISKPRTWQLFPHSVNLTPLTQSWSHLAGQKIIEGMSIFYCKQTPSLFAAQLWVETPPNPGAWKIFEFSFYSNNLTNLARLLAVWTGIRMNQNSPKAALKNILKTGGEKKHPSTHHSNTTLNFGKFSSSLYPRQTYFYSTVVIGKTAVASAKNQIPQLMSLNFPSEGFCLPHVPFILSVSHSTTLDWTRLWCYTLGARRPDD